MHVDVKIPGSVEAYAVDERGEKRVATEALWLETYLCSILRAFAYADDYQNKVVACRRFNPITNTEAEHRFLDAAERLFFKGVFHLPLSHEKLAYKCRLAARF